MKHKSYIAPSLFILIGLICVEYSLASAVGFHIHSDICIWFKVGFFPIILFVVIIICLIYIVIKERVTNQE
jgi:hypothetical protein